MIFRNSARERYVIISKVVLEDFRLSWKAKGLLCFLLSKPDNWNILAANLSEQAKDGVDSVYSGIQELEECKYIWKKAIGGKDRGGYEYWIYEEPQLKCPFRDFPERDFPGSGKIGTNEELFELNEKRVLMKPFAKPSDEAVLFVDWFLTLLPSTQKIPEKLAPWRKAYDDLVKQGRNDEDIRLATRWARQDSFWSKNFFSPLKLLETKDGVSRFDMFLANAKDSTSIPIKPSKYVI